MLDARSTDLLRFHAWNASCTDDGRMPPSPDDMSNLDRPLTRREFRAELQVALRTVATNDDLRPFATKEDLKAYATKEELNAGLQRIREEMNARFAEVHVDMDARFAQVREEMSSGFAELRGYIEFSATSVRNELRSHFDLTAESIRSEFRLLIDWVKGNTGSLTTRVDALETGHGARLLGLETRVTRLESNRN